MAPLCPRCLRTLGHQLPSPRILSTTARARASVLHPSQAAPRGPPSGSHEGPPAATSTPLAQPFSTPLSPAPEPAAVRQHDASAQAAPRRPKSTVPAGTSLKGLGWLKGREAPVARPDAEYPAWLWTLVDDARGGGGGASDENAAGSGLSEFGGTRKQRQRARKEALKVARLNPDAGLPKTPFEEQGVDLPSGDGSVEGSIEALGVRQQLTDAMRTKRRRDIKEANFLKGVR